MTRIQPIMNSNNLHHRLISKIRLRVTGRAIINPNNFPLESNQLAHHQIFSAAVMLHTTLSIGRVTQPYHFTVMLVDVHVMLQKNKKGTKKQELLNLCWPALPQSKKMFSKGCMYTVGACL